MYYYCLMYQYCAASYRYCLTFAKPCNHQGWGCCVLTLSEQVPVLLQALGKRCMSAEAVDRPKFDEILQLVEEWDIGP